MQSDLSQNGFHKLTARAIKLVLAVYRVTNHFPPGEPLKNFLRGKCNEIVLKVSSFQNGDKSKKLCYNAKVGIEGLKALFEIARNQNWVKQTNFDILSREYVNLEKEIEGLATNLPVPSLKKEDNKLTTEWLEQTIQSGEQVIAVSSRQPNSHSNGRHSQILEYLKGNGRVQISRVCQLFPQVSRRTLIRDLDMLSKTGLVERNGNGRGVCYQIKQSSLA